MPTAPAEARRPRSEDWATLLKKTFGVDALQCPKCGARTKVLAAIMQTSIIRKILAAMGHPTEAPPIASARPPPGGLDWSGDVGDDAA